MSGKQQLYSYADVIIDPDDPRVEIGAEYYMADYVTSVLNAANNCGRGDKLIGVRHGAKKPFICQGVAWACLIRKKDHKKYVPFDLSKPEVRDGLRGKWIKRSHISLASNLCLETIIVDFEQVDEGAEGIDSIYWTANGINSHELFEDWTFLDGTPCGEEVSE